MTVPVAARETPPNAVASAVPSWRRVLVVLPSWLGDVAMAAPTVEGLAAGLPEGASVVLEGRAAYRDLALLLPRATDFLPSPTRRGLRATRARAAAIRAGAFDAALVLPRSTRAALGPALARVPVRVGFSSEGRSLWLTHPVRGWRPLRLAHRSDLFGALLAPLGLARAAPWRLRVPDAALAAADALLAEAGRRPERPLVAFEAAASYGPAKRWPEAHFAALAARLTPVADVATVGAADSVPVETRIAAASGAPLLRTSGRTDLPTLAGVLRRAHVLVTNDTGPMHLAAAVGTPVVALFGATDPEISGPRGSPSRVLWNRVPCAPCFLRECPVPGHPCLSGIGVDEVQRAVLEALAGPPGADTLRTPRSAPGDDR